MSVNKNLKELKSPVEIELELYNKFNNLSKKIFYCPIKFNFFECHYNKLFRFNG